VALLLLYLDETNDNAFGIVRRLWWLPQT